MEGEIGDIGPGSEIHETAPDFTKGLTTPAQAKEFVDATGIDIPLRRSATCMAC